MNRYIKVGLWMLSSMVMACIFFVAFLFINGDLKIVSPDSGDETSSANAEVVETNVTEKDLSTPLEDEVSTNDETSLLEEPGTTQMTEKGEVDQEANQNFIDVVVRLTPEIREAYENVNQAIENNNEVVASLEKLERSANQFKNKVESNPPSYQNEQYAEDVWGDAERIRSKSNMLKMQYNYIEDDIDMYNNLHIEVDNLEFAAEELESIY
ncbi:hypothetical protein B0H94_105126 [Salsuginibacillus halophilus]|uniref:Uncharacterized protein n=1 Tax=Salsuginibacillus halophilus TaxID=517424 RepID=A0A2P8HL85_9BACI|nr:hypothetical protein [Salsuginibacillus halophilus]PSL46973.1 hypothetical protein B0H94_105126 [Salsuginibacillus halophilus]